jgi:hypothetical protein
MHPVVAHHAGEETLAPLLLLGGAWGSLLLTVARSRLAAILDRFARPSRRR